MAEDVIVVESRAQVALRTRDGKPHTLRGIAAIERSLVQRNLDALPERMLHVLDREPSVEELREAQRRGLVADPNAPAGDDRALDALKRDELAAVAEHLGLEADGKKADLQAAITAEAQRLGVDLDGSAAETMAAIKEAQDATPSEGDSGHADAGGDGETTQD